MKNILITAGLAGLLSGSALAQEAAPSIPVNFNAQERAIIAEMCEAALWANRRRFDGVCDYMRVKFEAAERAAKSQPPAPSPDEPKKD